MFGRQLQKTTKNDHEQEFAAAMAISTYQIMFHDPTMTQLISGLSGWQFRHPPRIPLAEPPGSHSCLEIPWH